MVRELVTAHTAHTAHNNPAHNIARGNSAAHDNGAATERGPAAAARSWGRGSPGYVRGLQLAEMRRAAGLTQVALARAMGISQARISKIEHGEVAGIDVVGAYVTALGGRMEIVARFEDRVWSVG